MLVCICTYSTYDVRDLLFYMLPRQLSVPMNTNKNTVMNVY